MAAIEMSGPTEGFLKLPKHIRVKIYDDFSSLEPSWIDLPSNSQSSDRDLSEFLVKMSDVETDLWGVHTLETFMCDFQELMLTCKTILHDLTHIFYSRNYFLLRCSESGDLRIIKSCRPSIIASLTNLSIRLAFSFTKKLFERFHWCIADIENRINSFPYDRPLTKNSTDMVNAWQEAAKHLEKHLKPHSLRLNLIADTTNYDIAQKICKPFKNLHLADCQIRLNYYRKPKFQKLAEESVLRAIGMWEFQSSKPFNFRGLPIELQLCILEHTHLVTPWAELQWRPEGLEARELHQNCPRAIGEGCFCVLEHSAYSYRCDCWEYPESIFLVNHTMNSLAKRVFFGKNKFKIHINVITFAMKRSSRLGIAVFLEKVSRMSALEHLKYVEIGFNRSFTGLDPKTYTDWNKTIQGISHPLAHPRLTIVILLERWTMVFDTERNRIHSDSEVFLASEKTYSDVFRLMTLTLPLRSFPYLKNLFVHLGFPNIHTKTSSSREFPVGRRLEMMERMIEVNSDFRPVQRRRLEIMEKSEEFLEKQVMGQCYDSARYGKQQGDLMVSYMNRFFRTRENFFRHTESDEFEDDDEDVMVWGVPDPV